MSASDGLRGCLSVVFSWFVMWLGGCSDLLASAATYLVICGGRPRIDDPCTCYQHGQALQHRSSTPGMGRTSGVDERRQPTPAHLDTPAARSLSVRAGHAVAFSSHPPPRCSSSRRDRPNKDAASILACRPGLRAWCCTQYYTRNTSTKPHDRRLYARCHPLYRTLDLRYTPTKAMMLWTWRP